MTVCISLYAHVLEREKECNTLYSPEIHARRSKCLEQILSFDST